MTIQSDEDLFFETKSPCGITIRIKKDKYWLLKRSLFHSAYLFAILLNYYLLDGNLFSLIGIVLIYCFAEDSKSIFLRMRLKKSKKLLTKIESDYFQEFTIQSEKLAQAIVLAKLKNNKNYDLKKCFKYIPPDDTVLFLYKKDLKLFQKYFKNHIGLYVDDNKDTEIFIANDIKSLTAGVAEIKTRPVTIFLSIADNDTFIKANDIAKKLKEKYGVEKVNVFALHCFVENPPPDWAIVNQDGSFGHFDNKEQKMKNAWFDKLITTNSTRILKIESGERLQVINCFF